MTDAPACDFPEARRLISARTEAELKNPPKPESSAKAGKARAKKSQAPPPSEVPAPKETAPTPEGAKAEVEIQPSKGGNILRHFVSSLGVDEADGTRLAIIVRSHWSCEARHWERDTHWREDDCLLRSANAACALALIRTGLQTLLRRAVKRPLPVIFEDVASDLDLGLSWLKQRML